MRFFITVYWGLAGRRGNQMKGTSTHMLQSCSATAQQKVAHSWNSKSSGQNLDCQRGTAPNWQKHTRSASNAKAERLHKLVALASPIADGEDHLHPRAEGLHMCKAHPALWGAENGCKTMEVARAHMCCESAQ